MSAKRNIALSGAIAAIVAVAFVIAAIYVLPGTGLLQGSQTQGPSGTLSVMLTDPPTVPQGTTDLYMTYNKVGVHVAEAGNNSGWKVFSQSGTIDLMQTINVSQTIAIGSLPAGGKFNALGFNVSSVVVTYNGKNYTADLVYGRNTLFVPIPGGISIAAASTQAVLIDMTPKVLLLGTPQNPTFAFLPSARAYVVPSNAIPAQAHFIGERHDLDEDSWWDAYMKSSSFAITNATLTPDSLSITAINNGNASVVFRLAAVSSQYSTSGGAMPYPAVSEIFVIEPNATLVPLSGSSKDQLYQEVAAGGYLLPPGASVTFTYSGQIQIGLIQFDLNQQPQQIVVGQHYFVSLLANDKLAQAGTTAISP
jgi:hypothetical protein